VPVPARRHRHAGEHPRERVHARGVGSGGGGTTIGADVFGKRAIGAVAVSGPDHDVLSQLLAPRALARENVRAGVDLDREAVDLVGDGDAVELHLHVPEVLTARILRAEHDIVGTLASTSASHCVQFTL